MKFLTLLTNPPEEVKPILAKKVSRFGYDDDYMVINLDPNRSSIELVIMALDGYGATHWNYIEDEGND